MDPDGRGDNRELGGGNEGKTVIKIQCMRKQSIFNKRGKSLNETKIPQLLFMQGSFYMSFISSRF